MKYPISLFLLITLLSYGCFSKTTTGTISTSSSNSTVVESTPDSEEKEAPPSTTKRPVKPPIMENGPGEIEFFASNDSYNAHGSFKRWRFTDLAMDGDNFESLQGTIEIDLTSVWEKSAELTEHLKAWDYFDVEKYTIAKLEIMGAHLHGETDGHAFLLLSMRGYEQQLDAEFQIISRDPYVIQGTAYVDRSIFKIGVENKDVANEIQVSFTTQLMLF